MTLTQLEYVLAVARERNFHRAAQACHVTQPTLSKLIKNLEEELGTVLFDRSKSPTEPTMLGKAVIEQARTVLMESARIQEVVSSQKGELKGDLRVGMIPTIGPYLLPLFLRSFRRKYPLVELSVSEMTTSRCLEALDREEIDLAVLATNESREKYYQDFLYSEKMLLFSNPESEMTKLKLVSVDLLRAEDLWLLEEGHCLRDEILRICQLRKSQKKRPYGLDLKIGSLESLRYLVLDNFGYTIVPELSTLRMSTNEKGLLRRFEAPEPCRKVYFTTRRKFLREAIISALKKEVLSVVKLP